MPLTEEKAASDKAELEKFGKYFAFKFVQAVVQSRLGEKMNYPCNSIGNSNDWFYLSIEDNPDILRQTRKAIGTSLLLTSSSSLPLLVEICVKPSDGSNEIIPIEIWELRYIVDQPLLETMRVHHHSRLLLSVYNRMSLMLKSIISISRVVPAYKYGRCKGCDFDVLYKVYMAEPDFNRLGSVYRTVKLGIFDLPYGKVTLTFCSRTKMSLSIEAQPVFMKSNHYSIEEDQNAFGGMEAIGVGAQADLFNPTPKIPVFSEPFILPSDDFDPAEIPFGSLLQRNSSFSSAGKCPSIASGDVDESPNMMIIEEHELSSSTSGSEATNSADAVISAGNDGRGGTKFEVITLTKINKDKDILSTKSNKEMPFAPQPDPSSDPASLFSTLQNPPLLESFECGGDDGLIEPVSEEIDKQLETFQENLEMFDEFVKGLCLED